MEKIQVYLPTPIFKELKAHMKEAGFDKESEFGKHIMTEWLTLRKYGLIKAAGGLGLASIEIPQSVGSTLKATYQGK